MPKRAESVEVEEIKIEPKRGPGRPRKVVWTEDEVQTLLKMKLNDESNSEIMRALPGKTSA